eukprot:gnl/TRDRNA2_/TRDRNA2_139284_c0_seq3.p1 gnl/TRDRNA2_/TRDRNA2_139284_c0~~gnl/TRDRNA2_/TRDRNA2_139284_c0_seq3.p1  ORF type:complete len:331 (+),score=18.29 gnl/TRDRNA2_/TRDRNA2_139284_c0_seq3:131-1123(+)
MLLQPGAANDGSSQDVTQLRQLLSAHNGLRDLEVCTSDEVQKAIAIFRRDGFVVVRDALNTEQLECMRSACDREIRNILALDRAHHGTRGKCRYSFVSASSTMNMVHHPEWAMLIDLPTVTPILQGIFGSKGYRVRPSGGGDFCLPGAISYQDRRSADQSPPPVVCCNFLMVDFTQLNGPTRFIPGTAWSRDPIPSLDAEPQWMRLSTLCPLPAGSVLIRDVRTWHGGTPNLSDEIRAIPAVEFAAADFREPSRVVMPRAIYDGLTEHGKEITQHLVAGTTCHLNPGYRMHFGALNLLSDMKIYLSSKEFWYATIWRWLARAVRRSCLRT